jgi:hypothetical protein
MTRPPHSSRFDHPNNIRWGYRSWNSSLYSFLHSPVTLSHLGQNILLNILFSNTLSLRSSFTVSDQVSRPYKTADTIIVPYISIFKLLDIRLKESWSYTSYKTLNDLRRSYVPEVPAQVEFCASRELIMPVVKFMCINKAAWHTGNW